MKKMLNFLGSITLFATGATATVFSTKTTSNLATLSSNSLQNENQEQEKPFTNFKNITRNTVEDILSEILVQKGSDVVLDYKPFLYHYESTSEKITEIKNFKLENTTTDKVKDLFFYKIDKDKDDGSWFIPKTIWDNQDHLWLLNELHIFASLILDPDGTWWHWPSENN